ncbi:MAG: YqaJ-like viral recombinase, partial [Caulobacteraceae bacterium]|nr:YqaJ-like viral recombinase [Caulobacteraceae bacterium]
MVQGGEEWYAARCGLLTASEMKLILTPKLKIADNDKSRAHVWELLAQRISGYVEPSYVSDDMLRGREDENDAKITYTEHYAEVTDVGFITNDKWGFTLGYSPDGLVGDTGLIECKSRRQKFQVETIASGVVPEEYMLQLQTALLVSERKWIDFVSYCAGLP